MYLDMKVAKIIQNDESSEFTDAKNHVETCELDLKTKQYYLDAIRTRFVLEQVLSHKERTIIKCYFAGMNLKEIKRLKLIAVNDITYYKMLLDSACLKFICFVDINTELTLTTYKKMLSKLLICDNKEGIIYLDMYEVIHDLTSINAFKYNANEVIELKGDGANLVARIKTLLTNYMRIEELAHSPFSIFKNKG